MKRFEEGLLEGLYVPRGDVHKGENGRVLVIGGSKLFHAAAFWPAEVASRVVDLVHFSSPASENNDLVRKRAKEVFWSGIVVDWGKVKDYVREDDAILIGPGMVRNEKVKDKKDKNEEKRSLELWGRQDDTKAIVDYLLKEYPDERWVMDGGALQEVDSSLLRKNMILTPHRGEFERVFEEKVEKDLEKRIKQVERMALKHEGLTILLKGEVDVVSNGKKSLIVEGGNAGMTKGGTGDVLAGLVVSLYAKSESFLAASCASYLNKRAGDLLFEEVGPFFNAGELVLVVSQLLREKLRV